jgi:hypothetical protein
MWLMWDEGEVMSLFSGMVDETVEFGFHGDLEV